MNASQVDNSIRRGHRAEHPNDDIDRINQLAPEVLSLVFSFFPQIVKETVIPLVCQNFQSVKLIKDPSIQQRCLSVLKNSKHEENIDHLTNMVKNNPCLIPSLLNLNLSERGNVNTSCGNWPRGFGVYHTSSDGASPPFKVIWNPQTLQVNLNGKSESSDYRTTLAIIGSPVEDILRNQEAIHRVFKIKDAYFGGMEVAKGNKKIAYGTEEQKHVANSLKPLLNSQLKGYVEHIANVNFQKMRHDFENVNDLEKGVLFKCNKFGLIQANEREKLAPSSFTLKLIACSFPGQEAKTLVWETGNYGNSPTINEMFQWAVFSKTTKMLNCHFGTKLQIK